MSVRAHRNYAGNLRDGFVQILWRPVPAASGVPDGQDTGQATPQDKVLESKAMSDLATVLGLSTPQATPQVTQQVTQQVAEALRAAAEPIAREALQKAAGVKDREHFRVTYLEPLLAARWLEHTIPDKPTSPTQKYRLTAKGRAWLEHTSPP